MVDTDDTRRTTYDGRRTTPGVWHKLPTGELKKENLVEAAVHFGITPAVGATKSHILDLIEDYCIENNR